MKVLHITEALAGGVYTYYKDLSHFFGDLDDSEGIETTLIYSGNREQIDQSRIPDDFSKNVKLQEISMMREFSVLKDIKSTYALFKAIKKTNPDVIHLHSSKAGVLGRIANFATLKRRKVFYTPHGYSFLRQDISTKTQKVYKLIEKSIQYIFGGTTIACGDTEYLIAKTLGKSELVRNGISIPEKYVVPAKNNGRLKVGIIGRITIPRNPTMFNEIALKFPEFDFLWIGDGELKSVLTAKNIKVTGWFFDAAEVAVYLDTLDIYIQTSLWEGLPIAVLEAMGKKIPVIATNVIGNKDIVVHKETGYLFDEISELDIYLTNLKDEDLRRKLGENGYVRCKKVFDKNKNFQGLLPIYRT